MKISAFIAAALFASSLLAGAEIGPFQVNDKNGILKVENRAFALNHFGKTWWGVRQNDGKVLPDDGFPKKDGASILWQGVFPVREEGCAFKICQDIRAAGKESVEYSLLLESPEAIQTKDLGLELELPLPEFLSRQIRLDGKPIAFPGTFAPKTTALHFPRGKHRLEIPLRKGLLSVSGEFSGIFQDNRAYKSDSWTIRLHPSVNSGGITRAELALTLVYTPFPSVPLPLDSAANMEFVDDAADDGKGGWTDQGPDNDLRMFPTGKQQFQSVPFEITRCIALRGSARPAFPARAELTPPEGAAGKYLYLLHGVAWEAPAGTKIGSVTVESAAAEYVDRETQTFDVVAGEHVANFWGARPIPGAVIGWQGKNPSAALGLYLTRFDLGGKAVKKITFESSGKSVWMIAGATLSDITVENDTLKGVTITAGKEYAPIRNIKDIEPGSILDFSFLLDAPAGKHGFLKNADGRFEFEKRPGTPARFYGANVCLAANCMEKQDVDRMVEHFAACGYNLLRLHHFDQILTNHQSGSSLNMHEWVIANMDYLIAACKDKGIYITLDLFTIRDTLKDELVPGRKLERGEYKALVFLDENVRKNFLEFSRRLLTRRNRHTGLMWKDDPAIAMISLVNEDTIFHAVDSSAYVRQRFEDKFNAWLQQENETLSRENRPRLWRRFLSEQYLAGYRELETFFRELGVAAPLTDQNFWGNIGTTLLRENYGFADNHFYWKHPVFLGTDWKLPLRVDNESAVRNFAGGVSGMAVSRLFGKPFSVSEWNYVFPNPHILEGSFLLGAYAASQDWSSLCRFAYTHGPGVMKTDDTLLGVFDVANDPVRLLSDRAGVLFFLRGDVSPSQKEYPILLERDHLKKSNLDTTPLAFNRLLLQGKTGVKIIAEGEPVPENAYTPTRQNSGASLLERKHFVNDTGELTLDSGRGSFLVRTPRSEALILPAREAGAGDFLSVANRDAFAGFLAAAMDGKSLAESGRILLLHLTEMTNSGIRFRDSAKTIVEDWGKLPLLLRRNSAEVELARDFTGFTLYEAELNGVRRRPAEFRVQNGKTRFVMENTAGENPVLVYELVRNPR